MPELVSTLIKEPSFAERRAGDPRWFVNGKIYERPIPSEEPVLADQRLEHIVAAAEDPATLIPEEIAFEARECEKLRTKAIKAVAKYSDLDITAVDIKRLHDADFECNVEGTPATNYSTWLTQYEAAWRGALDACNQHRYRAERFVRNAEREEGGYNQLVAASVDPAEANARQALSNLLAEAEKVAADLSRAVGTRAWFLEATRNRFQEVRPLRLHADCDEHQAIRQAQASLPEATPAK